MYCHSLITLLFSLSFLNAFVALAHGTSVDNSHNDLIRMPIAKLLNFTGTGKMLLRDQARMDHFRLRTNATLLSGRISARQAPMPTVSVTNATDQVVDYVVSVLVGTPPTEYLLLVDTGSANTWVGASKAYVPANSSTSVPTGQYISVHYGSGEFSGIQYKDTVAFTSGPTVSVQGIGAANSSSGFHGVDGILGIGPVDLTNGTLSPDDTACVPTITDNLFGQGIIPSNLVAISFQPSDTIGSINGELAFGGTDPAKYISNITYAPTASSLAAMQFFGIEQSISYGNQSKVSIMETTSGIVDTGTTLTLIPSDAFANYVSATGAALDTATNLLSIPAAEYDNLQSLFFTIGETVFEFPPNAQIWPRALNTEIGGTDDNVYLIIGNGGESSAAGVNFVNGMTFLERFYAVFDTTNHSVGFATTQFTNATIN